LLLLAVFRCALPRFDLPHRAFAAILTGLLTSNIVYFMGPWFESTL
jgi:hypothetical protein